MSVLDPILDFASSVAWPVVVIVLLWPLRRLLRGGVPGGFTKWIANLRRGAVKLPGGIEAEIELAAAQKEGAEGLSSPTGLTPAQIPVGQEDLIAQLEVNFREQLKPLADATAREDVLIRAIALARAQGSHEWIYNRIFGSQIVAMDAMREKGEITMQEMRDHFDRLFQPPIPDFTFESWLNFLTSLDLARLGANGFALTPTGTAFLRYVESNNLSKGKAL